LVVSDSVGVFATYIGRGDHSIEEMLLLWYVSFVRDIDPFSRDATFLPSLHNHFTVYHTFRGDVVM